MMILYTLIAVLCVVGSCELRQCAKDPNYVIKRHKDSFNKGDWSEFSTTLTKDVSLNAANFPAMNGRNFVTENCIPLYATGIRVSMHGEQVKQISDKIAYVYGYYVNFQEGKETEFTELGHYNAILQKSEEGVWGFHRLFFSPVDKDYSLTSEFWRKNN